MSETHYQLLDHAARDRRPSKQTKARAGRRFTQWVAREEYSSVAAPKIRRISMAPAKLDRRPLRRLCSAGFIKCARWFGRGKRIEPVQSPFLPQAARRIPWRRAARRRRFLLATLVLMQTAAASWSLMRTFPVAELNALQIAIVANFALLFAWISFSFWSNMAGFWTLWRNCKMHFWDGADGAASGAPLRSRTALLMPLCNEDVARSFAGLETIYRSLAATGEIERFDLYVLSDTSDPRCQAEEEIAWHRLCRSTHGFGRIFYRHRRNNIKRKSGNVGDFLRRWGQDYDHMVVLDADSIMSGESLVALARLMERSPQVGIIQTTPSIVRGRSLFARAQQFASRCYGPLFSASLYYWQLGESYYWGHNAIIRIAPFVKHCGLARLPGKAPLGGEILSHDFVEAALMGRSGWEVWIVPDLPGSYEEAPPTLIDELQRDRRWCQGNLQHLRILIGDGIKAGHRAILCMGVMAYASALLWLGFLVLTNAELAVRALVPPEYFSSEPSLFPIWPQWNPQWAIALVSTTALLLFLPKLFSLALILKNRQAHLFGGTAALGASVALEILLSTALAPLRMWFHAKFVTATLLGRQIHWTAQRRASDGTGWWEAARIHGFSTLFGGAWIVWLHWLDSPVSFWLLPVAIALLFSIPISVGSSRASLGLAAKRWRLFLTPEECQPAPVLESLNQLLGRRRELAALTTVKLARRGHATTADISLARERRGIEKPFILV